MSEIIARIWFLHLNYFWVALTVWSAIQPPGTLFPISLRRTFRWIFFFSILHWVRHRTQVSYSVDIDTGVTCELVLSAPLHETEWLSKQQVLPRSEQKWRSNETIISDTKIWNYCQKKKADNRKSGPAFEVQMEAPREVRVESEWVMKVTDK